MLTTHRPQSGPPGIPVLKWQNSPRQRKNSRKFQFPKFTVFVGIHGTKKISDKPTGIYCDLRIVNDVEESLRPILESRCEWNRSIVFQYLAARPDPLMSNIVCVVCPRGVFFLGVVGASWAYLVFDLHGWYSALYYMTVDFTYLLMTLMYLFY